MNRIAVYTGLLFTGIALGWLLRGITPDADGLRIAAATPHRGTPATPATPTPTAAPRTSGTSAAALAPAPDRADPAHFARLLQEQAFAQAVAYYERALDIDEAYRALLKPLLEAYLHSGLAQCGSTAFNELVDTWLDAYYQDIPVLLLLAENQRLCSSPEEAASTLQLATTYALQPGARTRVADAVTRLTQATDTALSQQQDWVALLGFFEYLQAIDLATPASELR
ncbi:MAG: hypothetical protein KDI17_18435, partial [Halioglobus sp.]|nr:hypothetical protein [Halioglobus sp.]